MAVFELLTDRLLCERSRMSRCLRGENISISKTPLNLFEEKSREVRFTSAEKECGIGPSSKLLLQEKPCSNDLEESNSFTCPVNLL